MATDSLKRAGSAVLSPKQASEQEHQPSFTSIQMSSMSQGSPIITPAHIQRAKAALHDAGIPVGVGNQALDLATAFYLETPQVSQTDVMRRERNSTLSATAMSGLH